MSEYWKSLPRKFCDICKCWFADNKASIEFHERGKRHKENAAKRIKDIKKKSIKDQKKQTKLDNDMAKIEKAALAAYKKDLQRMDKTLDDDDVDSSITDDNMVINDSVPLVQNESKVKKESKQHMKIKKEPLVLKIWYEGLSEDGNKYYWNTETSESQWDPPPEGFISLEEQNKDSKESATTKKDVETVISNDVVVKKEKNSKTSCTFGPQPRIDPYGQWETIEEKKIVEIDFQLPKPSEDIVEVVIPIATEEKSVKFKEKIIGSLIDSDPSEEVVFKKRKFGGSQKRNTRQRCTDDD